MLLNVLRSCSVRCQATSRSIPSRLPLRSFISSVLPRSNSPFSAARPAGILTRANVTKSYLPGSRILRCMNQARLHSSAKTEQTSATADSAEPPPAPLPVLANKTVGAWLLFSSTLVFAVIVVGGVTRLTEAGLSITEWRPITGILPPLSHEEWMEEFDKYKATPEFKMLNSQATLDDFKFIFYMEWGHRILGRLIGVAFIGPLAYFAMRKKINSSMTKRMLGLSLLLGAQGAMGWYMVKSGLEESVLETPGAVPRVSQYRLASHLGLAFLLYLGMFGTGIAVIKDWKFANGAAWSGAANQNIANILQNPLVKRVKAASWVLTGLVFLTALSGAFVAGLDAGLLYNEFPLMGGRLAPPADELFDPAYAKSADKSDLWWRNIFENPTTVQFDHRVLATTTYLGTAALYASTFKTAVRAALPPLTRTAITAAFAMANIQVLLGISTLLYLVPVPLAAAHQAGSVMLLSAMTHVLITLRQPSAAARLWRAAKAAAQKK
ncbi:electron transfer protein 1 [Coprinopsis cinerea okayama7|uniref:Electron transfer protein 1 n=1 Tax=Coprinopsis cinerea (strain Okayama-7 / 130 / ATCC MYA-4618 / FGSC 9003) TaxID=240176 RepID=A8NWW0_COPC7|nr:electron transfer protein 1 [Coprinopsis cinerea okayama7\|eukprot:XP_001836998.2 electron transfer protein 1 [Coprinopsis cinerea okayama7\